NCIGRALKATTILASGVIARSFRCPLTVGSLSDATHRTKESITIGDRAVCVFVSRKDGCAPGPLGTKRHRLSRSSSRDAAQLRADENIAGNLAKSAVALRTSFAANGNREGISTDRQDKGGAVLKGDIDCVNPPLITEMRRLSRPGPGFVLLARV